MSKLAKRIFSKPSIISRRPIFPTNNEHLKTTIKCSYKLNIHDIQNDIIRDGSNIRGTSYSRKIKWCRGIYCRRGKSIEYRDKLTILNTGLIENSGGKSNKQALDLRWWTICNRPMDQVCNFLIAYKPLHKLLLEISHVFDVYHQQSYRMYYLKQFFSRIVNVMYEYIQQCIELNLKIYNLSADELGQ